MSAGGSILPVAPVAVPLAASSSTAASSATTTTSSSSSSSTTTTTTTLESSNETDSKNAQVSMSSRHFYLQLNSSKKLGRFVTNKNFFVVVTSCEVFSLTSILKCTRTGASFLFELSPTWSFCRQGLFFDQVLRYILHYR